MQSAQYRPTVSAFLIDWIRAQTRLHPGVPLLFISGAQGIGKSTALQAVAQAFDGRVAMLGIDDFYLTRSDREALARNVDPLFSVRGPPGTHDIPLLDRTIDALLSAGPDDQVRIPVFDKRIDDRLEQDKWTVFSGRPDAILLEGWCVGALPDPNAPSSPAMNAVEIRDRAGTWRAYQEAQLAGSYRTLWDRADGFLHLCAPSFEQVLDWRTEQEETTLGLSSGTLPADRKAWVAEFIQHYERITRRLISGARRQGYALQVTSDRSVQSELHPAPSLIVFSDLDGTLLDHHSYSYDAASEALEALREREAVLVLSSSKTAAEIHELRADLGFAHCPAIVENGGGILEANSAPAMTDDTPHLAILHALQQMPEALRVPFQGFSDWSADQVAEKTGLSVEAARLAKQRQYSEPGLWNGTAESKAAFIAHLAKSGITAQQGGRFLTLSHGRTKADQMFELASRYAPAPIIALGDAPNDLEMIAGAHRGVIVENADGIKIDHTIGEAIGTTIRTTENGPKGWNLAILQTLALLDA